MNTRTTKPPQARPDPTRLIRPEVETEREPTPPMSVHTRPRRFPAVYYGWIILGVAMMGMFMSGPGQSYSVAAFIDPMLADLGLLRSEYSMAYLVATLISGASLPFVGRALDRFGARLLLPMFSLLLGLACLWMGGVRHLLGLYLGLAMVRCLGQGALTLISTWMVGQWFIRRRGTAMGLLGLGSTLSFMIFPANNMRLIEAHGWRGAWTALAIGVWVLLCAPAVLLVRNRPEDLGLDADRAPTPTGEDSSRAGTSGGTEYPWTARKALRTGAFWRVVAALATAAMVTTGLVFHQVSLLAGRGVSKESALGLLGVQALVACALSLVGGFLADRFPPRRLLSACMVFMAMAMVELLVVDSPWAAWPYSILLGMHMGIQRFSGSLTLINFFGRTHFGSINGIAMALVVGAAALGPLPLALSQDYLGRYEPALLGLLVFPLASAVAVWSAHPPRAPESPAAEVPAAA